MHIQQNASLKDYSTMRLGGTAAHLVRVTSKQELVEAVSWANQHNQPILPLGGGSNVIFKDGFDGLVIINKIPGFTVVHTDAISTTIRIGAGEDWDSVVARTVEQNLHGLEFLSAIPGTAGATPVQNVGAYGAEIADTFVELEAYDLHTQQFVPFDKHACQFTYRHSIFKEPKERRFIITELTLRLTKENPRPPFYASLQNYLNERGITHYTPQVIREAVVAVRAVRLPDPAKIPNTGSFFKNPIVPAAKAEEIKKAYPNLAHWPLADGRVKLAAGWLIEQAGLRGYKAHGMKTYEHHALVIINDGAQSYTDLLAFQNEIVHAVQAKFGVTLEQEPELL